MILKNKNDLHCFRHLSEAQHCSSILVAFSWKLFFPCTENKNRAKLETEKNSNANYGLGQMGPRKFLHRGQKLAQFNVAFTRDRSTGRIISSSPAGPVKMQGGTVQVFIRVKICLD